MGVKRLKLKPNHTWKTKPGHSICVIDRGLVRFDYPSNWIGEPEPGAVHLHDRPPSVESCDVGVSIFHAPVADVRELPREETLRDAVADERQPYQESEIHHVTRDDLEITWLEQRYIDTDHQRDARFRVALARGPVLCLISMNYWSDRAAEPERVWDEILRSLTFGMQIDDPTAGPTVQ